MNVVRWVLTDPADGDTYTFERNPREMTSPYGPHTATVGATGIDGRTRVHRGQRAPHEWTFTGDIRSKAMYEALLAWSQRPGRLQLRDHLGRTFEVLIMHFDPDEQRPTDKTAWRFTYRMKALVYREITS